MGRTGPESHAGSQKVNAGELRASPRHRVEKGRAELHGPLSKQPGFQAQATSSESL